MISYDIICQCDNVYEVRLSDLAFLGCVCPFSMTMCLTTVNGRTSTLAVRLSDFCRGMFRMFFKLETWLDNRDVIL